MTNVTHLLFDMNTVKSGPSERSSDKTLKTYHPPLLTPLLDSEPESGSANVPETNNGMLS